MQMPPVYIETNTPHSSSYAGMSGNFIPTTHLNVGGPARMPFSSPIGEEILSPVSPVDSPRTLPFLPRKPLDPLSIQEPATGNTDLRWVHDSSTGFDGDSYGFSPQAGPSVDLAIEAPRAETRNASRRPSRGYSVSKPSRNKSRKGMKGIKVITNFSKHHDAEPASQWPAGPSFGPSGRPGDVNQTRQAFYQGQDKQAGGFVSLSDLKALDDTTVPKGFWKVVVGDGKKQKRRNKGKGDVDAAEKAQKRKQPPTSGNSPQRAAALGFKNMNLRQNTRGYEEISDDEVLISAIDGGNTMVEPAGSIPTGQPGSEIVPSVGIPGQHTGHLAPSPTKSEDTLSPSDGPIVIGLSIPSGTLSEFQFSPESERLNSLSPARRNGHGRNPSEAAIMTPTILVTPAEDRSTYVPFPTEYVVKNRPRARSSVYSQPSPGVQDVIPPMPAVPANVYKARESNPFETKPNTVRDSSITVFEEDEDLKANVRGVSTYTVFEEDEPSTELKHGRYTTEFGGTRPTGRSSTDTAMSYRRSHGWWNYVFTPFLPNSNTNFSDKWERPALRSLAKASSMAPPQQKEGERSREKEFPHDAGSPRRSKLGRETLWSDMSAWEDERDTIGIAIDHTPRTSTAKTIKYQPSEISPVVIPGISAGTGTATGSQDAHQQNPYNPFRQVNKSGAEAEPHQQEPIPPHLVANPFSDTHQSTDQAQNPFLQDLPSDPGVRQRRELAPLRTRSNSEGTEFEEDNEIPMSHNTGDAGYAPGAVTGVGGSGEDIAGESRRAHQLEVETQPPPYSPPRRGSFPRYGAVLPRNNGQPDSPGPLSPGMTQILSSRGAIPMSDVPLTPTQRARAAATNQNGTFMLSRADPLVISDLERPTEVRRRAEARRQRLEKEDVLARKAGGLWRGRACFSSKGCFGRPGAGGRKRRRWIFGLVAGLLVLVVVLAIALSVASHKRHPTSTPSAEGPQWLNLTGFPPIPTSVTSIIKPDVVSAVTACVFPNTMWSCSLPKELQQSVSPNNPDQPNFKLQILYRNDSTPNPSKTSSRKRAGSSAGNAVSAGGVIRDWILTVRDATGGVAFQPAPPPPSLEEQRFLGKTTDNVRSSAKEGEETPFYISLLDTSQSPSTNSKRQENSSNEFPDLTAGIPPPSELADGTAAPANLMPSPLPVQQPVRLYDRGLPTEHYGFYNYFDRSIFLKSTALLNQSDVQQGAVPADENGGATESEARVRCTWAQTRFLVQIWTNTKGQQLINSSDPDTLPYPVTITLDRHGGDAAQKLVYCYGLDLREKIVPETKQVALENRAFGGALVGGGQGPLGDKITISQGGLGGIDGGTGGCRCEWRNFRAQG